MSAQVNYGLAAMAAAVGGLLAGNAWAGIPQPINVPEPGLFGIAAAGTVAILLLVRLRQKK
jgi:hypothetical protein